MAEPNETTNQQAPAKENPASSTKGSMGFMIAAAAVVVASIGGGVGGAILMGDKSAQPKQPTSAPAGQHGDDGEYSYYELEPIVVNLDEPRLARLLRISVVAAIPKDQFKAASELLEQKKPILKSWLTVYFSGCTLEDIRGPKNLNRIRREIETNFNNQLWPNGRGLIAKILFKELGVQ